MKFPSDLKRKNVSIREIIFGGKFPSDRSEGKRKYVSIREIIFRPEMIFWRAVIFGGKIPYKRPFTASFQSVGGENH